MSGDWEGLGGLGGVSLGQQGHEVAWGGGVRAQRRAHDVARSVPPALVPVVGAVCSEAGSDGLTKHHVPCSECNEVGGA